MSGGGFVQEGYVCRGLCPSGKPCQGEIFQFSVQAWDMSQALLFQARSKFCYIDLKCGEKPLRRGGFSPSSSGMCLSWP